MQSRELAGRRILVVEDDPIFALDLKTTLEGAGAVVIGPASSLDKTLRLAQEGVLDAAILDVRLEHSDTLPLAVRLVGLRVPFRSEHLVASLAELLAKSK